MARKDAVFEPNDEPLVSREIDPGDDSEAVIDSGLSGPEVDSGEVGVVDGNDQIVEEAPGIRGAAEMSTPKGDPGDLSGGGRSALLPDDLGTGDDPAPDDLTGGDFGSSLLDDLAGDPTDGTGGGGGMSDIDDQTGWEMDDSDTGHGAAQQGEGGSHFTNPTNPGTIGSEHFVDSDVGGHDEQVAWIPVDQNIPDGPQDTGPGDDGDDGDDGEEGSGATPVSSDDPVPQDDDDDDDEHESQTGGSDDPPGSQTMPAPDDGTGGEPDASDFIGGPGNVDPASETEPAGGAGELIGGRGDVDPAPETEPAGPAGELIGGRGDIDPFDGKSSLLGDDTGDLAEMAEMAEMAAEADLGDVEIEVDDSLADADIGDDV